MGKRKKKEKGFLCSLHRNLESRKCCRCVLLVLRKGGDVSTFKKALHQAVGEKAEIKSLVSKRSLEVRDLDETVKRGEVVATICIVLGKIDLGDLCRLY